MERGMENRSGKINEILGRLAAEKKKTIMVACLILVMIFIWVRAFMDKKPAAAKASGSVDVVTNQQKIARKKIEFIDLPYIKGRNDAITRDFFSVNKQPSDMQNNRNLSDNTYTHVSWMVKNLRLEAIGLGKTPQAFINGRVFSVGDELVVKDGNNSYSCEIIKIEQQRVLIRYEREEIELKFSEEIDVTY